MADYYLHRIGEWDEYISALYNGHKIQLAQHGIRSPQDLEDFFDYGLPILYAYSGDENLILPVQLIADEDRESVMQIGNEEDYQMLAKWFIRLGFPNLSIPAGVPLPLDDKAHRYGFIILADLQRLGYKGDFVPAMDLLFKPHIPVFILQRHRCCSWVILSLRNARVFKGETLLLLPRRIVKQAMDGILKAMTPPQRHSALEGLWR